MKILILCLIAFFIAACNNPEGSNQSSTDEKNLIKLKLKDGDYRVPIFSHVVSRNTSKGKGALLLKKYIAEEEKLFGEKELFGENRLQIYPNSLLYNDTEVMEALEKDKVQLAAPSLSKIIKYNEKLKIFDFPFLFKDITAVEDFYQNNKHEFFYTYTQSSCTLAGDVQQEKKYYLDSDCKYVVLDLWHGGMKQFSSNEEIRISSEEIQITFSQPLKRLTCRAQNSPIIREMLVSLGAKVLIDNDFSALYKKLKTKDINCQENTWSNMFTQNFHEVQDFFVETNHSYLGYLLITNTNFWNERLNEDKQEIWQKHLNSVREAINGEEGWTNKLNKIAGDKIPHKKLGDKRDAWCEIIYNYKSNDANNVTFWKGQIKGIEELVCKAIGEKEGCPFNFLREAGKCESKSQSEK